MTSPRVLYIAYWGAAEPLGRSLVLPAVRKLSDLGVQLTLVTFEKAADLENSQDVRQIRQSLNDKGVKWIPLRYHKRPKLAVTAFDVANGCARAILSRVRTPFDIVHSRTFIGGLIGQTVAPVLRSRLIYHNEGFYPDEQVDAGVWKLNSPAHRFARLLERRLYARADGIVALSNKAKTFIEKLPSVERKKTPVIVVPSCVDLEHFKWEATAGRSSNGILRLIYVGSIGGRYSIERIARFAIGVSRKSKTHLRILTQSDRNMVIEGLQATGWSDENWSVERVSHHAVPAELAVCDAGLHFLPKGISEFGGSPTKIGEYWASGIPVVVTPNAGDTEEIVRRDRVGVIIGDDSNESIERAGVELQALLADQNLGARCRKAAEENYALEAACDRQISLYRELTARGFTSEAGIQASELGKSQQ